MSRWMSNAIVNCVPRYSVEWVMRYEGKQWKMVAEKFIPFICSTWICWFFASHLKKLGNALHESMRPVFMSDSSPQMQAPSETNWKTVAWTPDNSRPFTFIVQIRYAKYFMGTSERCTPYLSSCGALVNASPKRMIKRAIRMVLTFAKFPHPVLNILMVHFIWFSQPSEHHYNEKISIGLSLLFQSCVRHCL